MGNDITLGGIQYGVVPGSYEKRNRRSGAKASGWERITIDRFEGQRQAFGSDLHRGWDSVGVGPVWEGGGVEPFPASTTSAESLSDTPSTTTKAYGLVVADKLYVGLGRRIYQSVLLTAGSWSAFTVAADLGAGFTISGLAYYQDDILIMLSTGQDIRKLNTSSNTITIWRSGEKGMVGCGYAGQLIYAPGQPNATDLLRLSGVKWNGNAVAHDRYLDGPILAMCNYNGAVAIATKRSLYLMAGQSYPGEADDPTVTSDTSKAPAWIGDPQQLMSHGQHVSTDDLTWLVSFRGKLYTWLGSRVVEYDGDRQWTPMGPEGMRSFGACVTGDWLIVSVQWHDTSTQIWGFDGDGWWLLSAPAALSCWPVATAGAGTWDVAVFRSGSTSTIDLLRLRFRSYTLDTYPGAGAWVSPMLTAGGVVRWSGVGASFAAPVDRGNESSVDSVSLAVDYSIDGGVTWVAAATKTAFDASVRVYECVVQLEPSVSARYLQLRVGWTSISDWAPVLERCWADYTPQGSEQPTRRVWELDIEAGDKTVRRDGSVDPRTGSQAIAGLWDAWEGQRALSFRDIEGSLWTPSQLPGLATWWRADTLSGLNDGDLVSVWPDAMGGDPLVQAAAAAQPSYQTAELNGYPVVRFGGNDWLTLDSNLGIEDQPFAQFAIWKPSGPGQALMLWVNNAGLLVTDFDDDVGIFSGSALFNFNAHAFGQWHMIAGTHFGLGGRLTVDGGVTATGSTGSGAPAGELTVGAGSNGIDRWMNGDLAELVIVRQALTADLEALMFGYAAHKYGLTGNLPSLHAYKTVAPRAEALVRIENIREKVGKPADRNRWGESVVHLELQEV